METFSALRRPFGGFRIKFVFVIKSFPPQIWLCLALFCAIVFVALEGLKRQKSEKGNGLSENQQHYGMFIISILFNQGDFYSFII